MADLCEKPRVIAIGGPTATGKTALSVSLARQFDGEIISADSMQIYKGLTIGTAKAMELGEIEGAMSSLSIVVSGLLTVIGAAVFANFL